MLVAFGGKADAGDSSLRGEDLVLLSAVAIALYYVLAAEFARALGVVVTVAWTTLFGTVVLLPAGVAELILLPARLTATAIGAALYLGCVVTVAGLWIWLTILRHVPVRIAASVHYLQPLIGIAASAALFGDALHATFLAGTLLVLLGIGLASAGRGRAHHASTRDASGSRRSSRSA